MLSSTRSSSRLPTTKNKCVTIRNHKGWQYVPITHDLGKGSSFRTRKTNHAKLVEGAARCDNLFFGDVPKHFLRNETSVSKVFRQHLKVFFSDSSLLSFHLYPNVSVQHPSHFPSKRIVFNMSQLLCSSFLACNGSSASVPDGTAHNPNTFCTTQTSHHSGPLLLPCRALPNAPCSIFCVLQFCVCLFLLCLKTKASWLHADKVAMLRKPLLSLLHRVGPDLSHFLVDPAPPFAISSALSLPSVTKRSKDVMFCFSFSSGAP